MLKVPREQFEIGISKEAQTSQLRCIIPHISTILGKLVWFV